jgi:hypothetical protein
MKSWMSRRVQLADGSFGVVVAEWWECLTPEGLVCEHTLRVRLDSGKHAHVASTTITSDPTAPYPPPQTSR